MSDQAVLHAADERTPAEPAPLPGEAIRTLGISRRFGRTIAVDAADLAVPRGSVYGLIGLNGSGKSTLIRMVMGLLRPTAGGAYLNAVDVAADPVRARSGVGYVPDRPTAYAWMRVREAVAFARAMQPRWNDALVAEMLRRSRIDPRQRVGKLSKGMGAKLSLALALGHDPSVLVLDEPTDGLDAIARDEFMEDVVGTVCERERTVLISSHALAEVERMADAVGLMHRGKLILQCPTEELVRTTKRVRAVLETPGAPGQDPPGCVWSRVDGREWLVTVRGFTRDAVERMQATARVRAVEVLDLSLSDIFKDMVRGQETTP